MHFHILQMFPETCVTYRIKCIPPFLYEQIQKHQYLYVLSHAKFGNNWENVTLIMFEILVMVSGIFWHIK